MPGQNTGAQASTATHVSRSHRPAARDGHEPSLTDLVISDFLPPSSWPTLQATLREICLCLTEAVPSVESAGVVIFPPELPQSEQRPALDRAEVIGAAPVGAAVLQIERQLGEGPVLTACGLQSIVTSGDLNADERWRRFAPAIADLQLHSAVAVPLRGVGSATAGVLSLYSPQREAFDARAMHLIAAVADVVRYAILGAEMLERTRSAFEVMVEAWDRARIVNQAVGVLIRRNCTEEQARTRLARMAGRGDGDLVASARTIIEEAREEAHLSLLASRNPPRNA